MDFFRIFLGVPSYGRVPQWPSDEDSFGKRMSPEDFTSSLLNDHLNDILQHIVGNEASPQEHPQHQQPLRDYYLKPSPSQKCDSDVDGNDFDLNKMDIKDASPPTFHSRTVLSVKIVNPDGTMDTRTVIKENKNGREEVEITETSENPSTDHRIDGMLSKSVFQRFAEFFMRGQQT